MVIESTVCSGEDRGAILPSMQVLCAGFPVSIESHVKQPARLLMTCLSLSRLMYVRMFRRRFQSAHCCRKEVAYGFACRFASDRVSRCRYSAQSCRVRPMSPHRKQIRNNYVKLQMGFDG